jgi:predicted nucleotidyltransferase
MINLKMSNITYKWVDVLMPFTKDYSARMNSIMLSQMSGVPQQTVSRIMSQLVELGLISYSYEGKNKLFQLDRSKLSTLPLYKILEGNKAISFILSFPKESLIIKKMLECCEGIILFGSYASGDAKKDSDLDLVLVGKYNKKKIEEIIKSSPIEIHEQIVSYSDLKKEFSKKSAISKEILENHILFGEIDKIVGVFLKNGEF